jgi:ABC-type transporter Mla maintaining outer membrane lipid asymmetry permease subunit MlaE
MTTRTQQANETFAEYLVLSLIERVIPWSLLAVTVFGAIGTLIHLIEGF